LIFSDCFDMLISKINFKKLKQLLFWYIFKQKYTSKNNHYNNTKYIIDNPANLDFFSGNISTSKLYMYVCLCESGKVNAKIERNVKSFIWPLIIRNVEFRNLNGSGILQISLDKWRLWILEKKKLLFNPQSYFSFYTKYK